MWNTEVADTGNHLLQVTHSGDNLKGFRDGSNSGDDCLYDDIGNMRADKNKGIDSLVYNHLNLPIKVKKDSGAYFYTARCSERTHQQPL